MVWTITMSAHRHAHNVRLHSGSTERQSLVQYCGCSHVYLAPLPRWYAPPRSSCTITHVRGLLIRRQHDRRDHSNSTSDLIRRLQVVSTFTAAARRDNHLYSCGFNHVHLAPLPRRYAPPQSPRTVSCARCSLAWRQRSRDDRSDSTTIGAMLTWHRSHGGTHYHEVRAESHVHGVCLHGGSIIPTIVHLTLRLEPCSFCFALTAIYMTAKFGHSNIRTGFIFTAAARSRRSFT